MPSSSHMIRFLDDLTTCAPTDIALVPSEDKDLHLLHWDESPGGKPLKAYSISDNVETPEILILLTYFKLCIPDLSDARIRTDNLDLTHQQFFSEWEQWIQNIRTGRVDAAYARAQTDILLSLLPTFFDDCHDLIVLIREYVIQVLAPFLLEGLFGDVPHNQRIAQWYKTPVTHKYRVKQFSDRLKENTEIKARNIKVVGGYCESLLSFYKKLDSSSTAQQYFYMSAYFGMLAAHHLTTRHFTWATIYSHRALDCYFQHLALDQSVLVEVGDRLEYPSPGNTDVTLTNTVQLLRTNGNLAMRDADIKFISRLNFVRNRAPPIHSVYCASEKEAGDFVSGVSQLIFDISRMNQWKDRVTELGRWGELRENVLLKSVTSIDTYYQVLF